MAALTTRLPKCCFVTNLPDVQMSGVSLSVFVTIHLGGVCILDREKMVGNENLQVNIQTSQIISNMASLAKPQEAVVPLPILNIDIDSCTYISNTKGQVIAGGMSHFGTIHEEWFYSNFLTWQPQNVETTEEQPQWLSFITQYQQDKTERIESKLYASNGRVFTQVIHTPESSPILNYIQIRTDFNHLWRDICLQNDIKPLCYDVYGVASVPIAGGNPQEIISRPYAQRYTLRPSSYHDVCFGFENTIGGFDTMMAQGSTNYTPDGGSILFRNNTNELEVSNSYTSIWEVSSGPIETERIATQFQDFFKSRNRYIFESGLWQKIVVTEFKVKHIRAEMNSYTFKYHLSEKNEGRYYVKNELNDPKLPIQIETNYEYKPM